MSYIQEEWKPVVGWEDRYEVSSNGSVRRTLPYETRSVGKLKPMQNAQNGYLYVELSRPPRVCGNRKAYYIHGLVAAAFIGPRPYGFHTNHIDADPFNNYIGNLEYVPPHGNYHHAAQLGLIPHRRLNPDSIRDIRRIHAETGSYKPIREKYQLDDANIMRIVNRRAWKHVT